MDRGLESQLQSLHDDPQPTALRFDGGPPLSGRVAVLPAAYNPPTLAHHHLLQLALSDPEITTGAALLSTRNVDKGVHGASLPQRIEMLQLLASESGIAVLATNQARLADQSRALSRSFPGGNFDFVVGYDTLVRVFDERYYTDMPSELEAFFADHRLFATNRAAHSVTDVSRFVAEHPLAHTHRDRILIRELDDHPASLSSTAAREHAAQGIESTHLLAPVAAYIREHGLYRGGRSAG